MKTQLGLFDDAPKVCAWCGHDEGGHWDGCPYAHTIDVEPRALAHTHDVETAKAAASANRAGKATNRRACLEIHARHDHYGTGLTDDEVRALTGLPDIEANRRCTDLRTKGMIKWLRDADGDLVTRKTRTGRAAGVCVITQLGRETLR